MGPSMRSRVAKRNYSRFLDEGYYVDVKAVKKSKTKKRKLSDMLISHWSKVELERFYKAYRRYGKNWKKIAVKVCTKTAQEAEVLFNTCKSYLSLPEGGATIAGLIAMMTDHYNKMVEGDRDPDSKQVGATSENHHKHSRVKSHLESSKGSEVCMTFQNNSVQPGFNCLSLLRRSSSGDLFGGNQARAVRKRTPRFPVSCLAERHGIVSGNSLKEQSSSSTPEDSTEKGIHVAALALARASQMGSLQELSETLDRRSENLTEISRDELKDAYSRSEGVDTKGGKRKMEKEVKEETNPLGEQTKLNEPVQNFSTDEESALDALQALSGLELGQEQSKKAERGSCFSAGVSTLSEAKLKCYASGSRTKRKKWNPTEEKILRAKIKKHTLANEILVEEANKTCACQLFPLDHGKVIQRLELASSSSKVGRTTNSAAVAKTALVFDNRDTIISRRKKRKLDLQKEMSWRNSKSHNMLEQEPGNVRTDFSDMKGKLSNCLSSRKLRRWCTFEWFYSSIDYPWFARFDFVEYLNHVRLGHVPRLTQVEWSIIRSSLGKPRRLSQKYLLDERKKLEQYRESVRMHYAELRAGVREGIPTDLAKPLTVGQRVIARHPKTGEIHDGNILTVDRKRYRVQFNKTELGVEFVLDTECMPSNPWENLPDDLRRQIALNWLCNNFTDIKVEMIGANSLADLYACRFINASQPSSLSPIRTRGNNASAYDKLSLAYKRKEALEMQLKQMKEEVSLNLKGDIVEPEQFRKNYAMVLLQLREASLQFGSALLDVGISSAYDVYDRPESHVVEIVESSRCKAKFMVDNAMKVMGSLDLAKDPPSISEVECTGSQSYRAELRKTEMKPVQHSGATNTGTEDQMTSYARDPTTGHKPSYRTKTSGDDLSELISASVATLLMIQACTERQYPPAEVAEILECALMRLQPRCPKNLAIYREIETCIGMIKSQMLALIPTRSGGSFLAEVSV